MMSTGADARDARGRRHLARAGAAAGPRRRRGGLPHHRREGRPPVPGRRHRHRRAPSRATEALAGYRDPKPMVFSGPVPDRRLGLPRAARRPGQAAAQRRRAGLRAGDVGRARLRLPLRLPRPAAHGDRARAARARVRPRPDLHRAQRRLPGGRWRTARRSSSPTPASSPAARSPRSTSRSSGHGARAERVHRHDHGALPGHAAAQLLGMDYLSEDRVELRYTLPLAEIVFDFFDQLKSRTAGYASLDYEPTGEQAADLVKVDILLHGEPVDAFSADRAQGQGLRLRRRDGRQAARSSSRASSSRCRSRPPSARGSSPARTSGPSARTCSPSATAATSPASASCSRSRRRARSG